MKNYTKNIINKKDIYSLFQLVVTMVPSHIIVVKLVINLVN